MNNRIKNQIKSRMENQIIDVDHECSICKKTTKHRLNFKNDITNCKECNNSFAIHDSTYESIYRELKNFGVQF
jgi:ribosomal protein L37AE/L43A